ncbi:MAG: hypothetical protein RL519_979 [Pseudomonadota bacterium]|jgi:DNA-binding XRE family transcriptional regulator
MKSLLDGFIIDIREWLGMPGNSKAKLARLTGLHRNTLLGCDRDDWNPTLDVLRKIEPHVRDWSPDQRGEAA